MYTCACAHVAPPYIGVYKGIGALGIDHALPGFPPSMRHTSLVGSGSIECSADIHSARRWRPALT
eukprot:1731423-Heterocapsa_arctica.AAC.1